MEEVFAAFAVLVAAAGPLAVGVTKIVDMIRNAVDPNDARVPKVGWNVAAFAVAILICLGWQFNIVAAFVDLIPALGDKDSNFDGVMGQVLSGILVGGMAGFWHERMDLNASRAKANRVAAGNVTGDTNYR